jgi:hypothetical protein
MEQKMTVEDLRKDGYKVRVIHSRYYHRKVYYDDVPELLNKRELESFNENISEPFDYLVCEDILARGGRAVVDITCPDGTELQGVSECSVDENYNRKKGITIAIGRALMGVK